MTRTTSKDLDQLVRIINERLGRPQYGWDRVSGKNVAHVGALTLDVSYGQPRLNEVLDAGGAEREIGPRLPRGQMETQLRAILYGIDLAEANVGGYGSLPSWQSPGQPSVKVEDIWG